MNATREALEVMAWIDRQVEQAAPWPVIWTHLLLSDADPVALMLILADAICEHLERPDAPEVIIAADAPRPELQASLDTAAELVMARYEANPLRALAALRRNTSNDHLGATVGAILTMYLEVRRGG